MVCCFRFCLYAERCKTFLSTFTENYSLDAHPHTYMEQLASLSNSLARLSRCLFFCCKKHKQSLPCHT